MPYLHKLSIMAGFGVLLLVHGCAAVQTSEISAPVQKRAILNGEAARESEAESSVIITPIPDGGQAIVQPLTESDLPAPLPDTATPPSSSAVIALLDNADRQTRGGELDSAAAGLERALRLEPRNPEIWQRLAEIRLRQGQLTQAENLAAKSTSLSGNNSRLIARNWEIIAAARQQQGNVAGAREAGANAQDAASR